MAKSLIVSGINMPLTAIDDFEALGKTDHSLQNWTRCAKSTTACGTPRDEAYILEQKSEITDVCDTPGVAGGCHFLRKNKADRVTLRLVMRSKRKQG